MIILFTDFYFRSNPTVRQHLVQGNSGSVTNSNFHFGKITVFLAHGWNGNGANEMNRQLTQG